MVLYCIKWRTRACGPCQTQQKRKSQNNQCSSLNLTGIQTTCIEVNQAMELHFTFITYLFLRTFMQLAVSIPSPLQQQLLGGGARWWAQRSEAPRNRPALKLSRWGGSDPHTKGYTEFNVGCFPHKKDKGAPFQQQRLT